MIINIIYFEYSAEEVSNYPVLTKNIRYIDNSIIIDDIDKQACDIRKIFLKNFNLDSLIKINNEKFTQIKHYKLKIL